MSAFNNYKTIVKQVIPIGYNVVISECLWTNSKSIFAGTRASAYHMTVALALTSDSQRLTLNHGYVGRLLEAQLGKASNAGRTIQTLYDLRRRSDYDKPRLDGLYSSLEEIRHGAIYELRMASPVFDIAYHEVRKELKRLSAGEP